MKERRELTIGDLYSVHNGLSKEKKYFGSGYPFIAFKDVFNYFFLPEKVDGRVKSDEREQESYSVKRGDVLITRTSETYDELGMSSVALVDYPHATYNGFCKRLRPLGDDVLPEFIGYYLRAPFFRNGFQQFSSMTTRASLKNENLLQMPVFLPSFEEQVKIAGILRAYDKLIENNRKQIKLLEEAAQRLYKEWFVDLRFPGHETASIDPATNLPEGWRVLSATDVFPITIGKTPSRKDSSAFSNEGIPWVSVSDMGKEGSIILSTSECLTQEGINSYKVKTVPEGSVLLSFKLTVGRVSIAGCTMASNEAIAHFVTDNNALRNYCFLYLKDFDFSKLGSTSSIGTAINSKIVKALPFVLPDETTLKSFDDVASSIIELIISNKRQIALLQEARDRLLPKLMSGEIEVD